jgi:hypothetical protein
LTVFQLTNLPAIQPAIQSPTQKSLLAITKPKQRTRFSTT